MLRVTKYLFFFLPFIFQDWILLPFSNSLLHPLLALSLLLPLHHVEPTERRIPGRMEGPLCHVHHPRGQEMSWFYSPPPTLTPQAQFLVTHSAHLSRCSCSFLQRHGPQHMPHTSKSLSLPSLWLGCGVLRSYCVAVGFGHFSRSETGAGPEVSVEQTQPYKSWSLGSPR